MRGRQHAGGELHGAAEQRLQRLAAAAVGDARHLGEAFAHLQHFGFEMRRGADRRGGDVEFFRVRLRQRDELLHRLHAEIGLNGENVGRGRELADRDETLERIVRQIFVQRRIDRVAAGGKKQRVAVGSERAAAPMPILPPPPARFSTTKDAPVVSCSAAAMMRAMMSEGPPGELATMIFTGRSG